MKNMVAKTIMAFTLVFSMAAFGGTSQQKAEAATTAADVLVTVGQQGADIIPKLWTVFYIPSTQLE
jgi:hypothetical protein